MAYRFVTRFRKGFKVAQEAMNYRFGADCEAFIPYANDLFYCLAPECRIDDTSWIRPGNCPWEWWNAMNVKGAGFEAGSNTATYKYYTDFAAEYDLDYVLPDGGWSGASLMEGHEGLENCKWAEAGLQ